MNFTDTKAGHFHTAQAPDILVAFGVGSCVIICLFDKKMGIGGMAHAMLPGDHTREDLAALEKEGVIVHGEEGEAKEVDIAIDWMIEELSTMGSETKDMTAKISGGAEMFPDIKKEKKSLGSRNTDSAIAKLKEWNIPILDQEIGGNHGRTVTFFIDSGTVRVESKEGEKLS